MNQEKYAEILKQLDNCLNIQVQNGTWNANAYMHGMANGLILAKSILADITMADYLEAPEYYIDDLKLFDKLIKDGIIVRTEDKE